MTSVLKGNFIPKDTVSTAPKAAETLEDQFEREALKRLGGSMSFVSKKKVAWTTEPEDGSK